MADNDIDNIHILKIHEVVPNRSANEVSFIFQYYSNDVDSTISAFQDGTASEILKKMNVPANSGKSSYKNKRKNKKKKKPSQVDVKPTQVVDSNVTAAAGDYDDEEEDSVAEPTPIPFSHEATPQPTLPPTTQPPITTNAASTTPVADITTSSQKNHSHNSQIAKSSPEERINPKVIREVLKSHPSPPVATPPLVEATKSESRKQQSPELAESSNSSHRATSHSKSPENFAKPFPRNRVKSTSSVSLSRTTSVSEESSSRPGSQLAGAISSTSHLGQGNKILEKSMKDLSRQTVALSRLNNLLEDELENSSKRLKNAISEAQRLLLERQTSLESEMERVKHESRQLLTQRKDAAAELKHRADRASTMSEIELQELRADIKQFVVDRKLDDELGKTHRFIYDKDRITEEITKFGEINHVKNNYSQRRQSVSSVGSSTCQTTSWNKEETANEPPMSLSLPNMPECPSDVGASHTSSSVEQFSESKPTHQQPFTARSRVFINTDRINSNDGGGGGGGGGQRGNQGGLGASGRYPRGGHRPYGPRGRGGYHSEGQRGGRGAGPRQGYNNNYGGKPHYSNNRYPPVVNPSTEGEQHHHHPPRSQRPPHRRGGRNPRYNNSYHNVRHNNNNSNQGNNNNESYNKDVEPSQVNGSEGSANENKNLVNGFVH